MRINSQTRNILPNKIIDKFHAIYIEIISKSFLLYFCIYLKTKNKNISQDMWENKSVKSIQMIKNWYNNINFSFLKKVSL
jgi:hypothetical protein